MRELWKLLPWPFKLIAIIGVAIMILQLFVAGHFIKKYW
jgi:hypothetical protein